VVEFPGVSHSIMYSHDNALRSIIADFLAAPGSSSADWGSLNRTGCAMANGVYECDADSGDQAPCVSYAANPAAPWKFTGKKAACAMNTPTCGAYKTACAMDAEAACAMDTAGVSNTSNVTNTTNVTTTTVASVATAATGVASDAPSMVPSLVGLGASVFAVVGMLG